MHTQFWLGTEASFEVYEKALPLAQAKQAEWEARTDKEDDEEPDFPPLYERMGDVGVIKIEGSLIPGEAGWMRYFGITGYADIKAAVLEGLADKGAKSLMIFSNSGGGSVAGVEDAESFIAQVAQHKPMSAYSEFSASAAYWLTSAAGHITTSPTGVNGSLGVIRVVTEYSKYFEKEGITKTVMRAGRYKALGNPFEPLSEDGKAEIQSKLDDLYQIFIDVVARNRGTTAIIADQVMGQGREFLGKRGLEAGLVDSIGDFESGLAYARANRKLATKKTTNFAGTATASVAQASVVADNAATTNLTGTQMHLTPEQLAAIAAGASVEQVTGKAEAPTETPAVVDTEAKVAESDTATTEDEADSEVVTFLKTELAAAQVESANAKAQAQTLASEVTALKADLTAVTAVVQASVQSMHVALGKKLDTTKMSATELVAEHDSAKTAMVENFKTGGVARSTASTQEKPAAPLISPRDAAAAKTMFNIK
jgi:signal peptide peptidase SppA